MNDKQKGALRSLARSIVFVIVPVFAGYLVDVTWLTQMGIPAGVAPVVAGVIGAVVRSVLPDVFGSREAAK